MYYLKDIVWENILYYFIDFFQKYNIFVSVILCLYYRREKDREVKEKVEKEVVGVNFIGYNGDNISKNK